MTSCHCGVTARPSHHNGVMPTIDDGRRRGRRRRRATSTRRPPTRSTTSWHGHRGSGSCVGSPSGSWSPPPPCSRSCCIATVTPGATTSRSTSARPAACSTATSAEVVADNRFAVINSTGAFSPYAYPWGLPLLLSPFVHLWDLDYNRLKLVEVAAFCIWLVLVHGIVRRRLGRVLALGGHRRDGDRAGLLEPHRSVAVGVPARGRRRRRHLVARPDADAWTADHRRGTRPRGARRPRDGRLQLPARSDRLDRRHRRGAARRDRRRTSVTSDCSRIPWRNVAIPLRRRSRFRRPCSSCSCPRCCSPTTATTPDTSTIVSVAIRACSPSTSGSARTPRSARSSSPSPSSAPSIGIRKRPGTRWSARRRRRPVSDRGQHTFPHGRSVLLPDHPVGALLRIRRDRRGRRSWRGAVAIGGSSRCSRRCRCCTSSRCTPRSSRATSATSRTSIGSVEQPLGPTDPRVTPVFDAVERVTPGPTTSSRSTGRGR